ncbi:MAG: two-component system sensor histidine kinase NtrB [Candidatus Nitrospinota bacterium M3_3B_026]
MSDRPSGKFENVLSSFTDAVIILDPEGRIEWLNAAAEQTLGVSLNVVAGSAASSIFPEGGHIHAAVAQAAAAGRPLTDHDTHIVNRKGERIPVGLTVHPLEDEGGGGMVVILRDLGALKALERYMAVSDRMEEMARLAAGVAHEIKNPLGGIRGAAQLLKRETKNPAAAEFTDLIISEVDRIDRLVVDLIDLNRPGVILKEPNNIYPILDDVLRLLKDAIDGKNISVAREYDPSIPPVLGDADRLRQVFLNLAKNAVEAMGDGGTLTLRTSLAWRAPLSAREGRERRFVLIEVTDDGPGMDEKTLSRAFTPFLSRKPGGSGLGLAMTLHIVQAHDGALELGPRADGGRGLTSSVYLPYSVEG